MLGHIVDAERVFAYRALRIGRGDGTPLAGFDQDAYVRAGEFERRLLSELAEEWEHARHASLGLFKGFGEEAWDRRGTANAVEVTVRALAWIMAGHELHHRRVLETSYLA